MGWDEIFQFLVNEAITHARTHARTHTHTHKALKAINQSIFVYCGMTKCRPAKGWVVSTIAKVLNIYLKSLFLMTFNDSVF